VSTVRQQARLWFVAVIVGIAGWSADRAIGQSGTPASNGDWPSYGLTSSETRFSPLAQIDATNVARLGRAWSADIGEGTTTQEATPLVVGGRMFVVTTWSVTIALDAKTGHEIWRWDPKVDRTIGAPGTNRICCGVVNRGLAFDRGKIFVPVIDGRLVALNADTGAVAWTAQATPKDDIAYTLTIAPRVVRGKVIVGNSGAEFPPYRGFFSAFDAESGRELWRFYTVPGDPSKPFENPALAAAAKTWGGEWWKYGAGGSVWDGLAYDADANLLYVGTGNGTPWPAVFREQTTDKDNLYTCSILAIDPDTGTLKWHYQTVPADEWDYDSTAQMILADLPINGVTRKVIMQAPKNGFFYVLDRLTGELISAAPFTKVSWARGVDPKTGRPIINPEARYGTAPVTVAPSGGGAHTWTPMSFDPNTGLVYFAASLGSTFVYARNEKFEFTPGTMNLGIVLGRGRGTPAPEPGPAPSMTGPEGQGPHLVAWDPIAQTTRWKQAGGGFGGGGALSTAGGLVFQSLGDGRLVAYTADKGDLKFEAPLTLRGMGPPMTYAVDSRQYIAVITPGPPRVTALALDGEHIEPPARPAAPAQ
jgi:PQQ-dependent dehydrogenase (methanol/ethanol family)